jgi:hypothetical protein
VNPEIILAIAVVVLALLATRLEGGLQPARGFSPASLKSRPKLALTLVILAPLLIRAALLPRFPEPNPRIHDEFAFLLGADTFAHGHLAYPQHPFWPHFESIHIYARPVYATAFPIAQSAILALGQVLTGHPWFGVWLSAGLFTGAIYWMLQAWVPSRWALLGAILAIARYAIASYWMNSYWGGFLAAAAGALVMGAIPRIWRSPSWRTTTPLALGFAILANTRPVEGAWFSAIGAIILFTRLLRKYGLTQMIRKVVAPLAVTLSLAGTFMMYDFKQITGKPWVHPYLNYRQTLTTAPHFVWQSPRLPVPHYNNAAMHHFYVGLEMHSYREARTRFALLTQKISSYFRFYFGPLLLLAAIGLPAIWKNPRERVVLLWVAAFVPILLVQVWSYAHYAAPATGLAVLLVIFALRHIRTMGTFGRTLVQAIPIAAVAMLAIQIIAGPVVSELKDRSWRWPRPAGARRARVLSSLIGTSEKHLVFVRYGTEHDPGDEWVYNSADIDNAPVIFARELDPASNTRLRQYFSSRKIWLFEPDDPDAQLTPYDSAPQQPMLFVPLGAPGIPPLRDPQLLEATLRRDGVAANRTCDEWNAIFTQQTGVSAPDATKGCTTGQDRIKLVNFDQWWKWLSSQP